MLIFVKIKTWKWANFELDEHLGVLIGEFLVPSLADFSLDRIPSPVIMTASHWTSCSLCIEDVGGLNSDPLSNFSMTPRIWYKPSFSTLSQHFQFRHKTLQDDSTWNITVWSKKDDRKCCPFWGLKFRRVRSPSTVHTAPDPGESHNIMNLDFWQFLVLEKIKRWKDLLSRIEFT